MSILKQLLQTLQPTENFDDVLSEFQPSLAPCNVDSLYCGACKMLEDIMDSVRQLKLWLHSKPKTHPQSSSAPCAVFVACDDQVLFNSLADGNDTCNQLFELVKNFSVGVHTLVKHAPARNPCSL